METPTGKLYIVATPIGNLKDITLRALETLKTVDTIICEDTRVTKKLLGHYLITKKLFILNDFNEVSKLDELMSLLKRGQIMALVSDAGSPLISDPGYKLVRSCQEEKIDVEVIPGPSAVITALQLAALPTDRFYFAGFPPKKGGKRIEYFKRLKKALFDLQSTVVVFESPHRTREFFDQFEANKNILVVVARELTKSYENVFRGQIGEAKSFYASYLPKGEVTIVLSTKA